MELRRTGTGEKRVHLFNKIHEKNTNLFKFNINEGRKVDTNKIYLYLLTIFYNITNSLIFPYNSNAVLVKKKVNSF